MPVKDLQATALFEIVSAVDLTEPPDILWKTIESVPCCPTLMVATCVVLS